MSGLTFSSGKDGVCPGPPRVGRPDRIDFAAVAKTDTLWRALLTSWEDSLETLRRLDDRFG
jgi:hypothetical protein